MIKTLFLYSDNEDGFIKVMAHERFVKELLALGYVRTVDEVKAPPKAAPKKAPVKKANA